MEPAAASGSRAAPSVMSPDLTSKAPRSSQARSATRLPAFQCARTADLLMPSRHQEPRAIVESALGETPGDAFMEHDRNEPSVLPTVLSVYSTASHRRRVRLYSLLIARASCRPSRLAWRPSRRSWRLSWRPARRSWRRSIPTVSALASDAVTKPDPAKPNAAPSPRSASAFRRDIASDVISSMFHLFRVQRFTSVARSRRRID
jgi:hypothetical protein